MSFLRLEVLHKTTYTFSEEVFLEPHTLLFRPKPSVHHDLHTFEVDIHPAPAGSTLLLDAWDNFAQHVWFDGMTGTMVVEARSELTMYPFAPLDFLVYPFAAGRLGFSYPPDLQTVLDPYLKEDAFEPQVQALTTEMKEKYGSGTIDYVVGSTAFLHENFERITRLHGDALAPHETIDRGGGSCRDLTRLHLALLRHVGLAARFVSGYLYLGPEAEQHELHAWTEVYIPGGGWIGADPTIGLIAANDHIRLATAHAPHLTVPVQGTLRGKATAVMDTMLEMTAL